MRIYYKLFNFFNFKKKMAKFKLYHSYDGGQTNGDLIGTYNTIEEAANKADNFICGERDHECIKSLIARGYYMRGYGTEMLLIEEV